MNITEKILAKASGKNMVHPGEIVDTDVDMVIVHDLTGPLAVEAFAKIGVKNVWDNKKVVVILDHQVPAESVKAAELHKTMRKFAQDQQLRIYDVGKGGICHQVMPEKGHVLPGTVIVGAHLHIRCLRGFRHRHRLHRSCCGLRHWQNLAESTRSRQNKRGRTIPEVRHS
jgi:3-isopropylmalate/(R)-2-methylmalate dehydratase large subunit